MPDKRRHRGRHPKDAELFDDAALPVIREAVRDLSWLLGRGYNVTGALKLVGDRFALRERQRLAVQRCACTEAARDSRAARRQQLADVEGREALIDGFNCVIAVEAALSGGALLVGRDGVLRDLSSVHGSYRRVEETERAVSLIAETLAEAGCKATIWLLDRPVSNSGRLAELIREVAGNELPSDAELHDDPDKVLGVSGAGAVVCSGDSAILDRCGPWLDLPRAVIDRHVPDAWLVDLSPD